MFRHWKPFWKHRQNSKVRKTDYDFLQCNFSLFRFLALMTPYLTNVKVFAKSPNA